MKNTLFTGAGIAIITPFNEDGSINYERLGEMIDYQIENGTDAIIICGTTGEALTMSDEEHLECIRFAVVSISADTSFVLSDDAFSDFSIERFMIDAEAHSVNAKIDFDESDSEKLLDISFASCSSIGDELKFESPDKSDIYTSNSFFSPYSVMF